MFHTKKGAGNRGTLKKKVSVVILAGLLSAPATLYAHSLSQAIHLALRNNPEIKSAYYGVGIADEQLGQAKAGWMPTVDLTLDAGHEYRNKPTSDPTKLMKKNSAVTITQPLFDGGATSAAVERSGQILEVSESHLDEIRTMITLQTIEAWYEIFRLQRVIQWTQINVSAHKELYLQIQQKVEAGGAGKAELVAAETPWLAAQSSLITARGEYRDAIARYTKVVGMAPTGVLKMALELPQGALPTEYESALGLLMTHNPIIKSARSNLRAVKADFEGTRAGLLPTLDFELKGGRDLDSGGNEGREGYYTALLKLNYNLFRGGADQSRRREFAKSVVDSQEQLNLARQSMEEQLSLYWNGLEVSHKLLATSKKQLEIAQENFNAVQEQFKLGEADVTAIRAADDALLHSRLAVLQDEITSHISVYRILAHLGVLLDQLALPEEVLDGFEEVESETDLVFFDRLLSDPASLVSSMVSLDEPVKEESQMTVAETGVDPHTGDATVVEVESVNSQSAVVTEEQPVSEWSALQPRNVQPSDPSWDIAYAQMKNAGWVVLNAVDELKGGDRSTANVVPQVLVKPEPIKKSLMLVAGTSEGVSSTKGKTSSVSDRRLKRAERRKMMLASRMSQYNHRSGNYSKKLGNRNQLLSLRKSDLQKQRRQFNRELDKYNLNSRKTGNWIVSN